MLVALTTASALRFDEIFAAQLEMYEHKMVDSGTWDAAETQCADLGAYLSSTRGEPGDVSRMASVMDACNAEWCWIGLHWEGANWEWADAPGAVPRDRAHPRLQYPLQVPLGRSLSLQQVVWEVDGLHHPDRVREVPMPYSSTPVLVGMRVSFPTPHLHNTKLLTPRSPANTGTSVSVHRRAQRGRDPGYESRFLLSRQ